ncbi:MAG: hypothetical protein KY468_15550 [Armatimonadetes bacterium]|nr:hypothetical protein [Armatimonadota bacterium]
MASMDLFGRVNTSVWSAALRTSTHQGVARAKSVPSGEKARMASVRLFVYGLHTWYSWDLPFSQRRSGLSAMAREEMKTVQMTKLLRKARSMATLLKLLTVKNSILYLPENAIVGPI